MNVYLGNGAGFILFYLSAAPLGTVGVHRLVKHVRMLKMTAKSY